MKNPWSQQSQSPDHSATETGLRLYQRIFAAGFYRGRKVLDRSSLPSGRQYLAQRGLLKTTHRGSWVAICCPIHKAGREKNPSLRVSLTDGHFRCMACGASGGDVIALHRLLTGVTFTEAVRDLGGSFHD